MTRFYWYPCDKYKLEHHDSVICSDWKTDKICSNDDIPCCCPIYNDHEELSKQILSDQNMALLNLHHDNPAVRKLCEVKLKYGEIEIIEVKNG